MRRLLRLLWRMRPGAATAHYRRENRKLLREAAPVRMVFLGDSITAQWRDYDPTLFMNGLLCRGVGGQTSGDMLARFDADVLALAPAAVHILAGTNDIARDASDAALERLRCNVSRMADRADAAGVVVLLASVPPAIASPGYPDRRPAPTILAFNAWLRDHAARHRYVYVDYHAALADADGGMRRGCALDGIHPSAAGYAAMRPIAEAAITAADRYPHATA